MDSSDGQQQVEREVRASLAFEHMISAALVGGGISAAAALVLRVAARIAEGSLGLATLLRSAAESAFFGVCVFLMAFIAALAVFTPIYVVAEKRRLRKIWPFHLAALAVSAAALVGLGQAPSFDAPARFLYLAPGFLIVALFGRRIAPLWRAADRAAAESAQLRLVQ